jgi:hypothetical protein
MMCVVLSCLVVVVRVMCCEQSQMLIFFVDEERASWCHTDSSMRVVLVLCVV